MKKVLDMLRVDKELLTPEEYIELRKRDPGSIKRTRIVASKLGDKGFGGIEVTYKSARYVAGC